MKKKILTMMTAMAMVLLVGCGNAAIFEDHNVRNSDWGDSMETVKASESIEPTHETPGRIYYDDKFLDYDAEITYIFLQEELAEVDFKINADDSNSVEDIYKTIDKKLEGAYGKCTADYDTFKCYRDDESDIWVSSEANYVNVQFTIKLENLTK